MSPLREYVRIMDDIDHMRTIMSEIDNDLKYDIKYELEISPHTKNLNSLVGDQDIKIYSFIMKEIDISNEMVNSMVRVLKNQPLESVSLDHVFFATRKSYYEFMTFLHSIKTLCFLYTMNIEARNDGEVYKPIGKSYIRKIAMDSYSEFVLEGANSSLERLFICSDVFRRCDVSLYVNEVQNLHLYLEKIDYDDMSPENAALIENFEKFMTTVRKVKCVKYGDCNIRQDTLYSFLNSNENLKTIYVNDEIMTNHIIEYLPVASLVLDELNVYISSSPESFKGTYERIFKKIIEVNNKKIVVKNIVDIRGICVPNEYMNIRKVELYQIVELKNSAGVENIKKIYFDEDTNDHYYEILKKPGNNVKEIKISHAGSLCKKLLDSLESEHCKISDITIAMHIPIGTLLEILKVTHKKITSLTLNSVYENDKYSMENLVNYLLDSEIEELNMSFYNFRIKHLDFARLIIKMRKIHIGNIEFIDSEDYGEALDGVLSFINGKKVLNEEIYISLNNGINIVTNTWKHCYLFHSKNSIDYSFKFSTIIKLNSIKFYLKKLCKSGEKSGNPLMNAVLELPSSIVEEIVERL